MSQKAAITINRSRAEVERLWREQQPVEVAEVRFADAPGNRGTEIHVMVQREAPGGKLGELMEKVITAVPMAKVKDGLRRFKQQVETGEVPRSEGTPGGESLERKFKQRPAQPLSERERERARVGS